MVSVGRTRSGEVRQSGERDEWSGRSGVNSEASWAQGDREESGGQAGERNE